MELFTKIAGVALQERQTLISKLCRSQKLEPGTELRLEAEPSNPVDKYAVKVLTQDGQQLGYISRKAPGNLNITISDLLRKGKSCRAYVASVTGGFSEKNNYGINIKVEY